MGKFVIDTPLVCLFYCLMGTQIHASAKLDAFVREFDLVTDSEGSSIEHQIRCRKVGVWVGEEGPTLRFRSVTVAKSSVVRGMLCLGGRDRLLRGYLWC